MPLALIIFLIAAPVHGAGASIVDQHPSDVITFLWWALGVLASFVTLALGGVGVWAIKKILEHDKDIATIKTKCKFEHPEEEI